MLDRTLYVAISRLVGEKSALGPHLSAHLEFLIALEQQGTLFASGPFQNEGQITGEGLTILRASSLAEARAILEKDPFVVAGVRRFELTEWQLKEGNIQVSLFASQTRGALP